MFERLMESQHTGRQYRITISLPFGYDAAKSEAWPFHNVPEKWSVVYVLDGNWYSGMVADTIHPMCWCGSTKDAIVVGIGYPEGDTAIETFRETFTRRNHDLTPARNEAEEQSMRAQQKRPAPTGDAANFLKFIQHELIPTIEADYRADPNKRILVGHSYGGLFAAFALFEAPDLFNTLVIGSPTLGYGDRYVFQQEEAFAKTHQALPANIFLYACNEEYLNETTLTETLRFDAILRHRNYHGMNLVCKLFMDYNHCEVVASGFLAGIKFALAV